VAEYVSPPEGVPSIISAVHASGIPLQVPRLLLAAINSLLPVLVYLILRRALDTGVWAALAGGLLLAVLSRDVIYYSSYILPDALSVTLFTAALWAAFTVIGQPKGQARAYLLCGILAGLALSVTIRLAAVVTIPFLAYILSRDRSRPWAKLSACLLGILIGFFVSSPYAALDLPGYLQRMTGLTWYQETGLAHRIAAFIYYLQGMFLPGFNSSYVDTTAGSVGLGIAACVLALAGFGSLLWRRPRQTVLMAVFAIVHLYAITSVNQNFTRHALVLYPIACILAGEGLELLSRALPAILNSLQRRLGSEVERVRFSQYAPVAAFILFILIYLPQANLALRYIGRMKAFVPSQVWTAEYLQTALSPGDRVGILDLLPWVEQDLVNRGVAFERIHLDDTLDSLQARGITHIVSTDRIKMASLASPVSYPVNGFSTPNEKLAEFGASPLEFEGYPAANLYMFVARVN
jgi:4-amino-4-deoxy-L-arabinose transferase-like glycosyltransferase